MRVLRGLLCAARTAAATRARLVGLPGCRLFIDLLRRYLATCQLAQTGSKKGDLRNGFVVPLLLNSETVHLSVQTMSVLLAPTSICPDWGIRPA
jgi:hypothetical protein